MDACILTALLGQDNRTRELIGFVGVPRNCTHEIKQKSKEE